MIHFLNGYLKELEKDYPNNVFLMTGLHPTHVKDNYNEEFPTRKENNNKLKMKILN